MSKPQKPTKKELPTKVKIDGKEIPLEEIKVDVNVFVTALKKSVKSGK